VITIRDDGFYLKENGNEYLEKSQQTKEIQSTKSFTSICKNDLPMQKEEQVCATCKWESAKKDNYFNIYLQPNLFGTWSITYE
jgi:hypothetical protein